MSLKTIEKIYETLLISFLKLNNQLQINLFAK